MYGAGQLLLACLLRLPCLPAELTEPQPTPVSVPVPAPVPAPARLPPPPHRAPLPAPLAQTEVAHYRIDYGVLPIGQLALTIDGPREGGAALVRAGGFGEGAILGLGRLQTRVEAEFDPALLTSRRWTSSRARDGGVTRDTAEQPRQGSLELVREEEAGGTRRSHATVPAPTFDPVGFLLRVRVTPPAVGAPPLVLHVLDGQALWRVTLEKAARVRTAALGLRTIRLKGRADPIHYDGTPDEGDRPRREFVLWLSDDRARLPLRLEMPIGPGTLVVALVQVERSGVVHEVGVPPGARSLYPTWRTVSSMALPGPSLARSRRTWMSTVRVPPA
jgi:hypothetical protein